MKFKNILSVISIIIVIGSSGCKTDTSEDNLRTLFYTYYLYTLLVPDNIKQNVTDNGNGTVSVVSQNLTWAKCPQKDTTGADLYNPDSNDCSGGIAGSFNYCSTQDSSCDNGTILNGAGSSEAWSTCANLTLAGRAWRVPTKDEFDAFTNVATSAIFPGTVGSTYWSADASTTNTTAAWSVEIESLFSDGVNGITKYYGQLKTRTNYVRCVSSGI